MKVVCGEEFKVGETRELSEFLDGEAAFEHIEVKDLQRRSIFEKEIESDPAPLAVRNTVYLNPDLLQLCPGRVYVEVGEDLMQHRCRSTELNFPDALHVWKQ